MSDTEIILQRAAKELYPGCIVNLGIGLPTLLLDHLDSDADVMIHSENGVLGAWKQAERLQMDPNLIDAAGTYVSTVKGCSFFDSAVSFAMIRRRKIHMSMIGAFEVDMHGSLANWKIPGKFSPGIGGAMELAQKTPRLIVLMSHCDKHGRPKILQQCRLPITAHRCVARIITEKAVLDVTDEGLRVVEQLDRSTPQQLQQVTEAPLFF